MEIDGEASAVEGDASQPPRPPERDFSRLHGFQFVGATEESSGEESSDEGFRAALGLELDARAARFHQAVDASIALGSDGTIRWLGDPVAKLAAGDDLLQPRTILLADEAMSPEAQTIASTRLDLWLGATVQRLLGPLFSLRLMQEGAQPLKDLATRIADALGVLDREPVKSVVRGLDQNSRALLRKQGVRFGSYYLYVPSTLRPACRALALQLWHLRKDNDHLAAAAQGLMPIASSGRTSAPLDGTIGPETYRIGGFRACGDRVVRVDIVERLADMIRAGSTLRLVGGGHSGASVFEVTNQMTSLAGCSGDGFSSILKGLGFESLTVPRAEVAWPAPAAPAAPAPEPSDAAPHAELTSDAAPAESADASASDAVALAEGSSLDDPADEGFGGDPAEETSAEDQAEGPADGDSADAAPGGEQTEAARAEGPRENGAAALPGDAAASGTPSPDVPPGPPLAGAPPGEAGPAAPDGVEAADAVGDAPGAVGLSSLPPAPEGAERPEGDPPAEGDAAGAEAHPPEAPATADAPIVVWRFARRQPTGRRRPPHQFRRPPSGQGRHAPQPAAAAQVPASGAPGGDGPAGPESPVQESPAAGPRGSKDGRKPGGRSGGPKPGHRPQDERKRWTPPAAGGGERKPAVDPNSPFAKLLELRAILESESKKRN